MPGRRNREPLTGRTLAVRLALAEGAPEADAEPAAHVLLGRSLGLDPRLTEEGLESAEHGVGQSKKAYLAAYRAGPELDLMRSLKKMLDPANILNPGKVI